MSFLNAHWDLSLSMHAYSLAASMLLDLSTARDVDLSLRRHQRLTQPYCTLAAFVGNNKAGRLLSILMMIANIPGMVSRERRVSASSDLISGERRVVVKKECFFFQQYPQDTALRDRFQALQVRRILSNVQLKFALQGILHLASPTT